MQHIGSGLWNWVAAIVYLVTMLLVGAYFTKRTSQDANSFFKTNGRLPSQIIGFSVYATTLSATTLMSALKKAFLTDWTYITGNIAVVAVIPVSVTFYVPFFKKLHITSAYRYLEARFGPSIRSIGSLLFIIFHLGRIAIVIYLPALAITAVSDINPYIVVSLVGILCILCTFLGGLEEVVWSDFIQGIILLGGALLIIIIGAFEIKGRFGTIIHDAVANRKIPSTDNWKLSSVAVVIPIIFLGDILNNLHQYTASQDVVQRYQTSESMEETKKSLWTNDVLALVPAPVFYGMSMMMYSFHQHQEALPKSFNTSSIVPYFILAEMPPSIGGLFITTMFAITQSTILSSLNSVPACTSEDIKHRLFGKRDDRSEVRFARLIIVIADLLSYGVSIHLIAAGSSDLWNLFSLITGLFGVSLARMFVVGIFTRRANTLDVIVGLFAGVIIAHLLHGIGGGNSPFYISIISFLVAFILDYVISLPVPSKDVKDITGLAIYDKDKASTCVSKTAKGN